VVVVVVVVMVMSTHRRHDHVRIVILIVSCCQLLSVSRRLFDVGGVGVRGVAV